MTYATRSSRSRRTQQGHRVSNKLVAEKYADIASSLDTLGRKFGADVFRVASLRYFKRQQAEMHLRDEIMEREAELARLRQRTSMMHVAQAARGARKRS